MQVESFVATNKHAKHYIYKFPFKIFILLEYEKKYSFSLKSFRITNVT
jgi:hypothetical protein